MKRRLLIGLSLASLVILSVFIFTYHGRFARMQNGSFIEIPIRHLSFFGTPRIQIEIENRKYNVLLDTGSDAPLELSKKALHCIKNKQFVGDTTICSIKGDLYPSKYFLIPEASIDTFNIFKKISVRREHIDQTKKGQHLDPVDLLSKVLDFLDLSFRDGSMGFTALKSMTCYFDYGRSILCMATDILALEDDAGYSLDGSIWIPLEIGRCGPVIQFETNAGPKRFLLDTGATGSFLISENTQNKNVTLKLALRDRDLGNWEFRMFKVDPFFEVDGVLGSDFFKKHVVCLDFPRKNAFIRSISLTENAIEKK